MQEAHHKTGRLSHCIAALKISINYGNLAGARVIPLMHIGSNIYLFVVAIITIIIMVEKSRGRPNTSRQKRLKIERIVFKFVFIYYLLLLCIFIAMIR